MMELYHTQRTVYWGHWGIAFGEVQPDLTKNFGRIIGTVYFPVGNGGPVDGTVGSPERLGYQAMVKDWIENGVKPAKLVTV